MMDFEREKEILATTYYHTATVKRPVDKPRAYLDDFSLETVYEGVPCAVSFTSGSTADLTGSIQPIAYTTVLFADPQYEIRAGDMVYTDELGHKGEYRAGEGFVYQSHIEVPLIRKDEANGSEF